MARCCCLFSRGCWGWPDSIRVAKQGVDREQGFKLRERALGMETSSRGKGLQQGRKRVSCSASEIGVQTVALETKSRKTGRAESAQNGTEQPSDEGFRTAVQEMSKSTNGASSLESVSPSPSYPSGSDTRDSDTSALSRTFSGRTGSRVGGNFRTRVSEGSTSFSRVWTRFSDTADEERRESSRGASSSGTNTLPLRQNGAVRRNSRTVVDRWVSDSDDEEDYLSRRPSRYEKRDRSLRSEVSELEREKVSNGKHKRGESKAGTGGGRRAGQVAKSQLSVQRFVHTELLSVARRRRELEKQQREQVEKENVLDRSDKGVVSDGPKGGAVLEPSDGGESDGAVEVPNPELVELADRLEQLVGVDSNATGGGELKGGELDGGKPGGIELGREQLDVGELDGGEVVGGKLGGRESEGGELEGEGRDLKEEKLEGGESGETEGPRTAEAGNSEVVEKGSEGEKAPLERRGKKREKARENWAQGALTRQVTELARRRQLDEVFKIIERAKSRGLVPSRKLMNGVMSACARCADLDRAREVFNDMVAEGGPGVNEVTYGALLKALGASGRVDEALRLLNLMGSPNAPGNPLVTDVHVITVLNACADAGDSLRARTLLEERAGRSTLAYNLLIKAHAKSGTPLGALLVVDEMRAHGLALDRNTYNSLILACVNGDNMRRAWELVKEMKSRSKFLENLQLAPDVITYSTLLRGVARPGALGAVLHVAEEMHTCPTCNFDRTAYGALIDACIRCGSPDTGESVLAEMEERGREDPKLRPGPYAFLSLMRAFALEGELERCEELREGLCSSRCGGWASVKERQEADELCLEAAVSSGYTGPAKRLLRTMKAVKEGRALSQRATAALVRLYASEVLYAGDSLRLQPLQFRADAWPAARVDTRTLPLIPELMFVTEETNPEEVAARLEATPVVLVVRDGEQGEGVEFLGYVSKKDLRGGDPSVADVMRTLPPPIAADDPISHAASLLLQTSSEVLLVVESEPSDPETLAQVVGIVTRGQLFEEVLEAGASGYHSDDDSGLAMIKQDLRKRGAAPGPENPEEVPSEARTLLPSAPVFPWKTRLAQLFELGREQPFEVETEEIAVSETEVAVEDDAGLEMIRQDMMRLEGGPLIKIKKKAGPKREQHTGSRQALAKLAYMEGLELDTDELFTNEKDAG